jgi:hypothetical protein
MTQKNNPFFARALVNRYWKLLFNRGLIDPEDDMRDTNPPSHPELLEALASAFVGSGYDLKQLLRILANSSTYQLSSLPNMHNASDSQYFSRYYARRLSAEQLIDAVNSVAGTAENWANQPAATRAMQLPDSSYGTGGILREFGRPDASTACTCERQNNASLGQSLLLATSSQIQDKLASSAGTAKRLSQDSKRTDEEKVQELYLSAFCREANASELMRSHLMRGRSMAKAISSVEHLFTPWVVHMCAIGEESGTLDHMLSKTAEHFEAEVEASVARLSSLMEPLLISVLGLIVGVMVVALYLPIFELGNVV